MKRVLLASASALAIVTGSAFAADVIAPEPVANWTGIHIGVGGGIGYNSYDAESTFDVDPWSPFVPDVMDIEGDLGKWYGFGTVEIGADYQFDNAPFVIGILASYDFNGDSQADSSSDTVFPLGQFSTANIEAELEDTWFVGGRLGFVFNETSLVYALGGYTWADAKVKSLLGFDFGPFGDDFGEIDEDESVDGFTIGAGIEQMLTENITLKIEYRHDFLDSIEWDEAAFDPEWGGVDDDNNMNGKVNFDRDTVRAVLSWRFGL